MKLIQTILGMILAVGVAGIAVMNPQITQVHISPLHNPLEYPVYMVILSALAVGFLIGAVTVWINMGGLRKKNRQYKRDIKSLKADKASAEKEKERESHEHSPHLLRH